MKAIKARSWDAALSQLELIILLGVLSVLAGIGISVVGLDALEGSQKARLQQDVGVLNSAVRSYLAFGGRIDEDDSPGDILARLKTEVSSEQRRRSPGLTGSLIDRSLEFQFQTEQEAISGAPRLYWKADQQRFVLAQEGPPGIKRVSRNPNAEEPGSPVVSDREQTLLYAADGNWIWDYEEVSPNAPPAPSVIPTNQPKTPPVNSQPFVTPSPRSNLRPPEYSISGGNFPAPLFPLELYLSNPNATGSASIYYSLNYGNWVEADPSVPILVAQDSSIKAQSIPLDSSQWNPSQPVEELYYGYRDQLNAPLIEFSKDSFFTDKDNPSDQIGVSLVNPNPVGLSSIFYRILPLPGGSGPTTSFQSYNGLFSVSSTNYPDGFGVKAYASALKVGYDDSRIETRFATEKSGLFGGHLDLDTSTTIAQIDKGSTNAHTHDITGKYGINEINFFSIPVDGQIEITEAVTSPSQQFKISVVNGDLSPGLNLRIHYEKNGQAYTIDQSVAEYDDVDLNNLSVFSLNGNGESAKLTGLSVTMAQDVIYQAGVIPTNTGDVKSNVLGKSREWRNGSLTLQALAVNTDGTDAFTTDDTLSSGGHGAAQSGMIWEAALFWHWDGDSYHEKDNQYHPGRFSSVSDEVDDPGAEYLASLLGSESQEGDDD